MSERTQRKLAAIVSADVVGYSRLMGVDEAGTLAALRSHRSELIDDKIAEHGGRIVKTMGDGLLLEFPSVVDATQCMIDVQMAMAERNEAVEEDKRIVFRIGVHLGDLVVEGDDIFGDGINVAARLEAFCEAGGVALSGTAHENITGRIEVGFVDTGEQQLKNISRLVRVWQWTPTAAEPATAEAALPLPDKPSIAVLPFDNMSGDPEQEYFADGIAEDLITALSQLRWLFVISRNSSFTYKGSPVDVRSVSRELGVRYVLEGSVRRAGTRIRITGQLIDATTGRHIWAERFDREISNIFDLQDEITAKIASVLGSEITRAEAERVRIKRPDSFDAWDHYLQALPEMYKLTAVANEQAKVELQKAISIDAEFLLAHAGLTWCFMMEALNAWSERGSLVLEKARIHSDAAMEIDAHDAHALCGSALVHCWTGNQSEAIDVARRAIELNANIPAAYGILGTALALSGEGDVAIGYLDRSIKGSPRDLMNWFWHHSLSNAHFAQGRYDDAIIWARRALEVKSVWAFSHLMIAASAALLGKDDEAERAVATLLEKVPRYSQKRFLRNPMWVRDTDIARLLSGLKRAGLPEN